MKDMGREADRNRSGDSPAMTPQVTPYGRKLCTNSNVLLKRTLDQVEDQRGSRAVGSVIEGHPLIAPLMWRTVKYTPSCSNKKKSSREKPRQMDKMSPPCLPRGPADASKTSASELDCSSSKPELECYHNGTGSVLCVRSGNISNVVEKTILSHCLDGDRNLRKEKPTVLVLDPNSHSAAATCGLYLNFEPPGTAAAVHVT
ncbi:hypothetical protein RRG08_019231 [Elysia crispata]|uniref:Uncharacterized protein n=1 Tax=Elysia crispata TaxID=231223 RepID=A0AAE1ATC4_9GAST|nr:hypothetical protein RRG08_019231 [Elysia crispata]